MKDDANVSEVKWNMLKDRDLLEGLEVFQTEYQIVLKESE